MASHSIFYYPYASLTDDQSPLLKVAAIYFDKLYILDPEKSSSGMIGIQNPEVAKDVALLVHKYQSSPAEAQRRKEKKQMKLKN